MTLPKFEKQEVKNQRFILGGSFILRAEDHEAHMLGEKRVVIAEVEVLNIGHKRDGNGNLIRQETTTIRRWGFLPTDVANTLIEKYTHEAEKDDKQQKFDVAGAIDDPGGDDDEISAEARKAMAALDQSGG